MTGPVCQQIKAEVSSLCDAPPGRYLIMYEIDIRAFGGSLSTSQSPPPPPPLGLLVSPSLGPSFPLSRRAVAHTPSLLPLSLFPHRFPYLLDRCISSLRVKSCQVYSPFLRQQTRTNIRKKSLDLLFFDRLFISMGGKNDLKVYR